MRFSARSLVDLTDDLLATEQPLPEWLRAAWAEALTDAPAGNPERSPEAVERSL